jgi:hypothetical protein
MNSTRRGSVLLEILVAMLILFMTIFIVTVTVKRLGLIEWQKQNYETLYLAFFSVLDDTELSHCHGNRMHGKGNGFTFERRCSIVDQIQTKAENRITLVRMEITMKKEGLLKSYVGYKTFTELKENNAR